MKNTIYMYGDSRENKYIYSGIGFRDFVNSIGEKIEHLLLLKGDFLGDHYINHFEIVDGVNHIGNMINQNFYKLGNFAFVDVQSIEAVKNLSPSKIAELLYFAHMFEPMESPFYNELSNQFSYISHDDSYYCKLYCRNQMDILKLIFYKIKSIIDLDSQQENNIKNVLLELIEKGVILNIDNDEKNVKLYCVGVYEDMDELFAKEDEIINGSCDYCLNY